MHSCTNRHGCEVGKPHVHVVLVVRLSPTWIHPTHPCRIPWALYVLLCFLRRLRRQRILVAVCCIDPRSSELPDCLDCIRKALKPHCILLVTRASDQECATWLRPGERHLVVPDYPDPTECRRPKLVPFYLRLEQVWVVYT